MKVKLHEIVDSMVAPQGKLSVLGELCQLKLRFKLKYKLLRIYTACESELKRFQESHLELIRRFGGIELDGGIWKVPEENLAEFQPEFQELANLEVEIWGQPISPDEFEQAETLHCEKCGTILERGAPEISGDLSKLFWLIHEPITLSDTPSEIAVEEIAPSVNQLCPKLLEL